MANNLFKIILAVFAVFLLAGCGHKSKLNIPKAVPATALNTDLTPEGMVRMGQRLEQAGDLDSAGSMYADAIEADRTLVEAHMGMARVLSRMGQENLAAIEFGNAFNLEENNYRALTGYVEGLLNNAGQTRALEAIARYMKNNPPTPELLNYQGVALDLAGDYGAAEAAYRGGLKMTQPGDAWNGRLMGNLALSMGLAGNTSEAILLLNPFIGDMRLGREGITPYQSSLRQNLALIYALSGNPDSAVEVAKSALNAEAAEYNRPFYEAIAGLAGPQRVRAVLLGQLPE